MATRTRKRKPAAAKKTAGDKATNGKKETSEPVVRWTAVMTSPIAAPGNITWNVHAFVEGVSKFEVARAFLNAGTKFLNDARVKPMDQIATVEKVKSAEIRSNVARTHPAVRVVAKEGWYLCAACFDVYEGVSVPPEDFSEIPPELADVAIPCSFHLDPSKAPMAYEQAAELRGQLEEDRKATEKEAQEAEGATP